MLDPGSAEALARVVALSRQRTPPRPAVAETVDPRLWLGSRALDPELTLRETPLRDGCIVTLGAPGVGDRAEPTGVAELRVAGGPAAGGVHRLGLGERTVGLAPIGGVAIADPALADEHLRVVVGTAGVSVAPMPGRVVLREGQPVPEQGVRWEPGELLEAGNTMLGLGIPTRPDTTLHATDDGGLVFDRPPRRQSDAQVPHLEIPLNRGSGKKADNEYAAALARFNTDLWLAAHYDALARRQECPDPAELLLTALGPRRRLWERRWRDLDALQLRVGVRSLPSQIDLVGPGAAQIQTPPAWSVPVTVPLRELGVLGVAGPAGPRRALARWLLVQAAVLHSPRDLSIVVFGGDGWEWVRWLPHLRPRHGEDATILVGNDAETTARRTAELTALIAARSEPPGGDPSPVLIVVDSARPVRQLGGMRAILSRGPAVGVFAICLDEEEHLLPEECRGIVGFSREDPARVHVASTGAEECRDVLADQVSATYSRQVARALAPLRDGDAAGGPAAQDLRLLEWLDLDPPTANQIAAGWWEDGASPSALLGASPGGEGLTVDFRSSPHCLIAGAAGSGKSELLQTLIAALAVANPPDAVTFLIVDDGQSSELAHCAQLPHVAARLTTLDSRTTARVSASLIADMRQRERVIAGAGAADIDEYLARTDHAERRLPRLVIVIDEFATVLHEQPALAVALADVAHRGRSVGIHLVIATEHPHELMSSPIAANNDLRIALRMSDEAGSHAVIGAPVAARIPVDSPGAGFARLGASKLLQFQLARVSGGPPGAGRPVTVHLAPWATVGQPQPRQEREPAGQAAAGNESSDIAELVAAVAEAAEQLDLPAASPLWLPPLPDVVNVADLRPPPSPGESGQEQPGWVRPVPYALADLPAELRRETMYFDLQRCGHLIVVGAVQSGRSTLLRTIAAGVAATASPDDVHLHVIDCGNDALRRLESHPHCKALLTEEDTEELGRLLTQLAGEVTNRHELFAREGYADIAEQRSRAAASVRLPYLLVLLDGWEDFVAEYDGSDAEHLIETARALLAQGAAVGVTFVVSSDRSGLVGALSTIAAERVLLRLDDPTDYDLGGANGSRLPAVVPSGRGLRSRDGAEIQVAVVEPVTPGSAQPPLGDAPDQTVAPAPTVRPAEPPPVREERVSDEPMPDEPVPEQLRAHEPVPDVARGGRIVSALDVSAALDVDDPERQSQPDPPAGS